MDILCSKAAVPFLNKHKCTVTCHVPNKDGTLRPVPSPPLWDHDTKQPIIPGKLLPRAKVADEFGLKCSNENNGTWHHDPDMVNAYIAQQPYKQQLATAADPDGGLLNEVKRILEGSRERRAFWFTGSGGNPIGAGTYSATGDKETIQTDGSNGHFTTVAANQSIDNPLNLSLLKACLIGKRINLFATGHCLPEEYRVDSENCPQTVYLGPGILDRMEILEDERSELEDVAKCNPDIETHYLEHRTMRHFRFHFVPDMGVPYYDEDEKWEDWTHLHVCSDNVFTLKQNVGNATNHNQLYAPLSKHEKPCVYSI
jgi:hypothetical protein